MAVRTELALFAGAGGGLLASRLLGHRVVCYVEREPYFVEVLRARIGEGYLDDAPIWDDVRTFDGGAWRGCVDIVSAGFPCQPFSAAGQRRGAEDERNGWPDTGRIIREVRPRWVFLENVPGLLFGSHGYFGRVVGELAACGYDCRWDCVSASAVGAPHRRDRLWVVAADTECGELWDEPGWGRGACGEGASEPSDDGVEGDMADPDGAGLRKERDEQAGRQTRGEPSQRSSAPGSVADTGQPVSYSDVFDGDDGGHGAGSVRGERPAASKLRGGEPLPHAVRVGRGGVQEAAGAPGGDAAERGHPWWSVEPGMGRVADELATGLDGLGAASTGEDE